MAISNDMGYVFLAALMLRQGENFVDISDEEIDQLRASLKERGFSITVAERGNTTRIEFMDTKQYALMYPDDPEDNVTLN